MKKIIAILLLVVFAATAIVLPVSAETEPTLMVGDADFDGKVAAADALVILRITVLKMDYFPPGENATQEQLLKYYYWQTSKVVGDVDNNGYISAEDALWVLKYVVGKEKQFPETDVTKLVNYSKIPTWPL